MRWFCRRPGRSAGGVTRIAGQGVAIIVALDQSSSMTTVDFPADRGTRVVSRLEAAKTTFAQFVAGRPDDLIGLVAFANYPDLIWPPALDHARLIETVTTLRSARPGDDGTNIGDAIAVGLDALLEAPPTKKVLVLLTDGNNEPAVPRPLDPECGCPACTGFSRGCLRHLCAADEMLGAMLLSLHNLHHFHGLMRRMRDAIRAGTLAELRRTVLAGC